MSTRTIDQQCAADDLGTIIDTVEALHILLNKFLETHGEDITSRLERAWPKHSDIGPNVTKPLVKMLHQITPPED